VHDAGYTSRMRRLLLVPLACAVCAFTGCFVSDAMCRLNPVVLGCDSESEVEVESCETATRPCHEAGDCDSFVTTSCEELPSCSDVADGEPCYDDDDGFGSSG
jgi:hypothetical protein